MIETIASIVILAIAIPPMMWAVRQGQRQRVDPMLVSKARWLATEKIEDIIADRNSSNRGFAYIAAANYPNENPVAGFANFNRTVTITQTGPDLVNAGTAYKKVVVTVSWTDSGGVNRTLPISTVVAQY